MKRIISGGLLFALLLLPSFSATAANVAELVQAGVTSGNYDALKSTVATTPALTDDVVRSLLQATEQNLVKKPDVSSQTMTLAASMATKITPPSVPEICSDVRRIVTALPPKAIGTPLYTSVVSASETFSKAPVVVSAGRPKLCEEAWIDAKNLSGDVDAELAQTPGVNPPSVPPFIIKPSAE